MLLDANVLIALVVAEHEHHEAASLWCADLMSFAVCPITQGALVRFLVRVGESAATAHAVVRGISDAERCHFLTDDLSFGDVDLAGLLGPRQVTDAYLAALASHHGRRLATLDRGLASAHPDVSVLVPQ